MTKKVKASALVVALVLLIGALTACGESGPATYDGEYKMVEMTHDGTTYGRELIDASGMDLILSISGTKAVLKSTSMKSEQKMTFDPDNHVFKNSEGETIDITFEGSTMVFDINDYSYKFEKQ